MKRTLSRCLQVATAAFFIACAPALAQFGVTNHGVPVSKGLPGSGIFNSVGPCLAGIPILGAGISVDPVCGRLPHAGSVQAVAKSLRGNPTAVGPADVQDFTISGLTNLPTPSTTLDWLLIEDNITNTLKRVNAASLIAAVSGGVTSLTPAGGAVSTTGLPITGVGTILVEQMTPGGRLSVVGAGGGCNTTTDQVAQPTLYYLPCSGQWVPVYNGTVMNLVQFTSSPTDTIGASISLGANWTANTLYDAFYGWDSGASTYRFCTGPAYSNSGAGISSRASALGTYKGLAVNAGVITCRYSNAATFSCAANQCTYLGTALMGASAGTIDVKFGTAASGGGPAVLSICNAYNRLPVRAASSDSNVNWPYTTATWRAANAGAGGNTRISVVSCNGDVVVDAVYTNVAALPAALSASAAISIGLNSITAPSARASYGRSSSVNSAVTTVSNMISTFKESLGSIGLNTINAIEIGDGTNAATFQGNAAGLNSHQLALTTQM